MSLTYYLVEIEQVTQAKNMNNYLYMSKSKKLTEGEGGGEGGEGGGGEKFPIIIQLSF